MISIREDQFEDPNGKVVRCYSPRIRNDQHASVGSGSVNSDLRTEHSGISSNLKTRIARVVQVVAARYTLSTTGYEVGLGSSALMTPERAQGYVDAAKKEYPEETLKQLATLQSTYINNVSGTLSSPHDMDGDELKACLARCREKGFANCEIQALEVALHLRAMGYEDLTIVSNKKISHNYVVLSKSKLFPKGGIVDAWTGGGFQELTTATKYKYKHFDAYIEPVNNMMDFIKRNDVALLLPDV